MHHDSQKDADSINCVAEILVLCLLYKHETLQLLYLVQGVMLQYATMKLCADLGIGKGKGGHCNPPKLKKGSSQG
jgi:hypothetical protein